MDWKTRLIKRAVDVSIASAGLAVTAPLIPVIAVAVRMTSPGPVLFRQTRCAAERRTGLAQSRPVAYERRERERGFHTFEMVKFRTMSVDAEKHTGPTLAQKGDSRLTPIGGFLRKTRLDELPQLVHVLKGDMSIVGPRPERPEILAEIEKSVPFFEERMRLIKPGLTGLAQINLHYDGELDQNNARNVNLSQFMGNIEFSEDVLAGANPQSFANKLLFDLAYSAILENPVECLKTDLKVMLKTPWVMLRGKGR